MLHIFFRLHQILAFLARGDLNNKTRDKCYSRALLRGLLTLSFRETNQKIQAIECSLGMHPPLLEIGEIAIKIPVVFLK